jgi:hypothetical protein
MTVKLVPTHGCYQKTLSATLCGETPTEYRAVAEGERRVRRFRKDNGMPILLIDKAFPYYRLVIEADIDN